MSYLGFPRLQFAGGFTANPSTINNLPENYDEPENPRVKVNPSWNPYGSASFTIEGAVQSCLDASGNPVGGSDPVLQATFKNNTDLFAVNAKLVAPWAPATNRQHSHIRPESSRPISLPPPC